MSSRSRASITYDFGRRTSDCLSRHSPLAVCHFSCSTVSFHKSLREIADPLEQGSDAPACGMAMTREVAWASRPRSRERPAPGWSFYISDQGFNPAVVFSLSADRTRAAREPAGMSMCEAPWSACGSTPPWNSLPGEILTRPASASFDAQGKGGVKPHALQGASHIYSCEGSSERRCG